MSLSNQLYRLRGEVEYLKKNNKKAWAKFYESKHQEWTALTQNFQNITAVVAGELTQEQFVAIQRRLQRKLSCKSCSEVITADTMHLSGCGHFLCVPCLEKMEEKKCSHCGVKVKFQPAVPDGRAAPPEL